MTDETFYAEFGSAEERRASYEVHLHHGYTVDEALALSGYDPEEDA